MAANTAEFDRTFNHHTTEANGVRLHYVMRGTGDPIVLLHGFPQTWYEWRHIMPTLAEHYTVIAPDLRGAGDSAKPATGYDKRTLAADIYELVQQLGFDSINLVGHDIGLQVAYAYAAEYLDAVRKLVLIDAPLPGSKTFEQVSHSPLAWHFEFHAVPDLPEALVFGNERLYITHFIQKLIYNPAAMAETDLDEYDRAYSIPGAMRASFEYYRAFPTDAEQNKTYFKTKLPMPILAMNGDLMNGGQGESYVAVMMQEIAENIQGVVIDRCGHFVAEEQPEELARHLLAFFQ